MMVMAPASARASTQPRPMPRAPPVTRATLPGTLNFSRYIASLTPRPPESRSQTVTGDHRDLTRSTSLTQRPALRVETMGAGRIGREPHLVALLQAELADCTRGYP